MAVLTKTRLVNDIVRLSSLEQAILTKQDLTEFPKF